MKIRYEYWVKYPKYWDYDPNHSLKGHRNFTYGRGYGEGGAHYADQPLSEHAMDNIAQAEAAKKSWLDEAGIDVQATKEFAKAIDIVVRAVVVSDIEIYDGTQK
jgi:hypothetical protein